MDKYNTKQKEMIWKVITNTSSHFSLEDISFKLKGKKVGKTTIYRYLKELTEQGVLKKYYVEGLPACFEYIKKIDPFYHLKCLKCNKLYHLHCSDVEKMTEHIQGKHHFQVYYSKIIFYGVCESCQEEEK